MNFLRSIIVDARPSKPMLDSSNSSSVIITGKSGGFGRAVSSREQSISSAADHTNSPRPSPLSHESTNDLKTENTSSLQTQRPDNLDLKNIGSDVVKENSLTESVTKSEVKADEENTPSRAFGDEQVEQVSVTANISNTLKQALTDHNANTSQPVETDSRLFDEYESTLPTNQRNTNLGNTFSLEADISLTKKDNRSDSKSSVEDTEQLTNEVEQIQTASDGSHQMVSSKRKASLLPSTPVPDVTKNSKSDNLIVTESHEAADKNNLLHASDSQADNGSSPVSVQVSIQSNTTEKKLHNSDKENNLSPNDYIQLDSKKLFNPESFSKLKKWDGEKNTHHNVQIISKAVVDVASQELKDSQPEVIAKEKTAEVLATKRNLDSVKTIPVDVAQVMEKRSEKSSANLGPPRTVIAKPLADLISKNADKFNSNYKLTFPEKKPESPKIHIGQIDIIIETEPKPASKPEPVSSSTDLSSRYYLRRL